MTKMVRLSVSGSGLTTPQRTESDLKRLISALAPGKMLEDAFVRKWYFEIGKVIGEWQQRQAQLDAEHIAKTLRATAKNLSNASLLFAGRETGVHSGAELAAASALIDVIAADPSIRSADPSDILRSIREQTGLGSHYCYVAVANLPTGPGKRGRIANEWYILFVALLQSIFELLGIKPTLYRHRTDRVWKGRLLDVAGEIEKFLPERMRSPSDESRAQRLERSLKVLRQRDRQK
jgi:hypothetical protein